MKTQKSLSMIVKAEPWSQAVWSVRAPFMTGRTIARRVWSGLWVGLSEGLRTLGNLGISPHLIPIENGTPHETGNPF